MTRQIINATALHRPTFRFISKHWSPLGAGLFLQCVKLLEEVRTLEKIY